MVSHPPEKVLTGHIDKSSPLPYHYQLREIIRAAIVSNQWQGGDQLPSENQLCQTFQVSRTTVREALDVLVMEGLLTREKGLGTFVANPKFMESWSGSTIGFSDSITSQGFLIETHVLELKIVRAPNHMVQELQLQTHDQIILLKRLRHIQKQPVLVVDSYLPAKLFPNLLSIDFTNRSLYQTFRTEYNIQVSRVKRSIEAIAASDAVARLLEVNAGFPIMYIENTAYAQDGTPLEYYDAWRRGDKTRFQFEYSLPPT